MAAAPEPRLPELVELPHLTPADLDPLLANEIEVWQQRFEWDLRPSADLLRRFLHIHSLFGCALRWHDEVVGYSYFVTEQRKGLIGDFYLRPDFASPINQMHLLGGVVDSLMRTHGVRRIESQMMLLAPPDPLLLPFSRYVTRHDRYFMRIGQESASSLPEIKPLIGVQFVPWADRHMEEMAHVLSAAYRGHVDSEINDQYRNIPGARQFLMNIIKFPGCGRFSPHHSTLAIDTGSGRLCGFCLTGYVSEFSAHITQLCVLPAIRGTRVGYELLRRTMANLVNGGATSISLTVTCTNVDAVRLYRSIGFQADSTFPALVWEGF